MMTEGWIALGGLLSYLLGAVPFSLLLGFLFGRDIRAYGSGNTGATNLARVVGYSVGGVGLLLDFLKGFAPAFWGPLLLTAVAGELSTDVMNWTYVSYGFLAIAGHCFPVYLKFDGGKGVATSLGVFVAILPVVTAVTFLFWGAVALISGWVSLASILSALMLPVYYLLSVTLFGEVCSACEGFQWPRLLLALAASMLVVGRHHENIRRLLKGEERKFRDSAERIE